MHYIIDDYYGADTMASSFIISFRGYVCPEKYILRDKEYFLGNSEPKIEYTKAQCEAVMAFFEYLWSKYRDTEAYLGLLFCQGINREEAIKKVNEELRHLGLSPIAGKWP